MTVDVEEMVRKFMEKHNQYRKTGPDTIDPHVSVLRLRLMMEELGEVATAIHQLDALRVFPKSWKPEEEVREEKLKALTLLADGLADLVYVVVGTAIAYGIPFNEVFAEVQRSNMTKGSLDANQKGGKVGKSTEFEPPLIREILEPKLA
jgi:predicted HAD superfamily Cof-like phosphohydrolase